jgi:hypothetical protein
MLGDGDVIGGGVGAWASIWSQRFVSTHCEIHMETYQQRSELNMAGASRDYAAGDPYGVSIVRLCPIDLVSDSEDSKNKKHLWWPKPTKGQSRFFLESEHCTKYMERAGGQLKLSSTGEMNEELRL